VPLGAVIGDERVVEDGMEEGAWVGYYPVGVEVEERRWGSGCVISVGSCEVDGEFGARVVAVGCGEVVEWWWDHDWDDNGGGDRGQEGEVLHFECE
jgi:hypothetical protein